MNAAGLEVSAAAAAAAATAAADVAPLIKTTHTRTGDAETEYQFHPDTKTSCPFVYFAPHEAIVICICCRNSVVLAQEIQTVYTPNFIPAYS